MLYLIVEKTTKEIITASEKNDTVIPENAELKIISGGFKDYPLPFHILKYKFDGGIFVLNQEKIDAEAEKISKDNQDKASAKAELKALGLSDKTINFLI